RERLLLAACAAVVLVYAYSFLFIQPLLTAKARLVRDIEQSRSTAQTFTSLMKSAPTQVDPGAARRAYRDQLRVKVGNLDKEMQGLQKSLVPPQEVAKLLEGVLARHRQLQLVSLHKLPVQRLDSAPAPSPAKGAAATKDGKGVSVVVERAMYQHSFELIVQGSYSDLHDYLSQLEKLPWQMFWGRISVDASAFPRLTATITVHTLSLDKAWLIV
ncbi:MAG TPA: hypothetical protein VLN59_13770, partial [Burkholderiales bacterium]|nr:hypothetical protein [Burkholderiales bacterium]